MSNHLSWFKLAGSAFPLTSTWKLSGSILYVQGAVKLPYTSGKTIDQLTNRCWSKQVNVEKWQEYNPPAKIDELDDKEKTIQPHIFWNISMGERKNRGDELHKIIGTY